MLCSEKEEKCYKLSTHVTLAFSYLCSSDSRKELLVADGAICVNGEVEIRVVVDAVEDLVVQTVLVSGYHLEERGACWKGRRGCSLQWWLATVYQVYHTHIPMGAMERVVVLYSSWEKTGANSLMSVRKRVKSVVVLNEGTPSSSATIVTVRKPAGVV